MREIGRITNEFAQGIADITVRQNIQIHWITLDKVPEIAEGLNRSKQVDDPSLENLKGHFEKIRAALEGKPGSDQIAYHMGDSGSIYITDILLEGIRHKPYTAIS